MLCALLSTLHVEQINYLNKPEAQNLFLSAGHNSVKEQSLMPLYISKYWLLN